MYSCRTICILSQLITPHSVFFLLLFPLYCNLCRHALPDHYPVRHGWEWQQSPVTHCRILHHLKKKKKIHSHIPDFSVCTLTVTDSIYHQHHHVRRHCQMTFAHTDPSNKKVFMSLGGVWQSTSRIKAALRWKDFDQLSPLLFKPSASCWLPDPEAEIAPCSPSTCPLVY